MNQLGMKGILTNMKGTRIVLELSTGTRLMGKIYRTGSDYFTISDGQEQDADYVRFDAVVRFQRAP